MNLIPVNTMTHIGFQHLCEHLNPKYNFVSRSTVMRIVKVISDEAEQYHVNLFKDIPVLAATTDVWTAFGGGSYASLTVSFVDKQWNYRHIILSCQRLYERHPGKELAEFILGETRKYGLSAKVCFVTTDGASNAKRQVDLSAAQEGVLLDIVNDPSFDVDVEMSENNNHPIDCEELPVLT